MHVLRVDTRKGNFITRDDEGLKTELDDLVEVIFHEEAPTIECHEKYTVYSWRVTVIQSLMHNNDAPEEMVYETASDNVGRFLTNNIDTEEVTTLRLIKYTYSVHTWYWPTLNGKKIG